MVRRLIATDMDGTVLRSDMTVSTRVRDALAAAREAGWIVAPVSGRMPITLRRVADAAGMRGYALAGNGAVGFRLGEPGWLFERTMGVDAQTEFVFRMRERLDGVVVAAVRDGGDTFLPERGYLSMMDPGDHGRNVSEVEEYDLEVVLSKPAVKMVMRRSDLDAFELLRVAQELAVPGIDVSISGAPFLEIAAEGVNKGAGLARLAEILGVEQRNVVAFGDHVNDIEMISWAGHGVAMGNAVPGLRAVADEVAPTNDEDGLAVVLERLLSS
jgi:Cof subfamily protein (haloacid dehalogenase superfamily)